MATRLGECRIEAIVGGTIRGWFKSVYTLDVGEATVGWAAMFLWDAIVHATGDEPDEDELRAAVRKIEFTSPNTEETSFVIELADADLLADLRPAAWDSYYVG